MTGTPVQVVLPSGETVWARVTVDGGVQNVASTKPLALDIEEFRKTVGGLSTSLRDVLEDLVPDEIQFEFGLELTLKSGKLTSMIAEAGGKASVKVTLGWTNGLRSVPAVTAGEDDDTGIDVATRDADGSA